MADNLTPELIERFQMQLNHAEAALGADHQGALRLFNGFFHQQAGLAVDIYATTLVVHDQSKIPNPSLMNAIVAWYIQRLPWITCALIKTRHATDNALRKGVLAIGSEPTTKITEHEIHYRIDLTLNQDCGFYLDTVGVRSWLQNHSAGKRVLNTFAYTGSLGLAALAGGAQQVTQVDLNRNFIRFAKDGCALNHLPSDHMHLMAMDFFPAVSHLKKVGQTFDTVLLDPPFFSVTRAGKVDLNTNILRLVNKVRPLVVHGGKLIIINNALYVSGQEFLASLDQLCADGYVSIGERIDVPSSFIGDQADLSALPSDPSPFNHSTKIVILNIRKKEV